MTRALVAACLGLMLGVVSVTADDLSVVVDPRADLRSFRTFALRPGKIDSPRPELDNRLFVKKLAGTIRAALIERGLTESVSQPDLLVDFTVTGEDFAMGVPTRARGVGPQPVRFTEGTLVIDLVRPADPSPVWRGTYRDDEMTGSKLAQKLPEDARKLIGRFPRRTR